jgi:hypothetical protein
MGERLQLLAPQLGAIHRQRIDTHCRSQESTRTRSSATRARRAGGNGSQSQILNDKRTGSVTAVFHFNCRGQLCDPETDTVRMFTLYV